MLLRFTGGMLYDPTQSDEGVKRDLWVRDGRIVAPNPQSIADETIDLSGKVVMAGAIDLHTHIGGGKLAIARTLLPERWERAAIKHAAELRAGLGGYAPSSFETGYQYARLGYTACFEPAMLAAGARQTHFEMSDIPIIDHGAYVILGNEPALLAALQRNASRQELADYVAWMIRNTGAMAVKVVNPGGIDAFKFGARTLDVDQSHPHFGVTPRDIVRSLTQALCDLQVPHPLHVHCSNLGIPGNWESTLATVKAAEGRPIHLTHVQFHSYGTEGPRKFSSQAAAIAELVNQSTNVTIDIGQIIFGQTVTVSADVMHQFGARKHAKPNKWVCSTIENQAGCGVVPFKYRDANYVHALQWAIGLELLLLVKDPWRVFLTTDHPNGGPFTSYPHLIRLLMDRTFREDQLRRIHPEAAEISNLKGITREYSLKEIAILTRAAPARILGLSDHGHLRPGAIADLVVYRPDQDRERMFAEPSAVYRRGVEVVRDGAILATPAGQLHCVRPATESREIPAIVRELAAQNGVRPATMMVSTDELQEINSAQVIEHPCRSPSQ